MLHQKGLKKHIEGVHGTIRNIGHLAYLVLGHRAADFSYSQLALFLSRAPQGCCLKINNKGANNHTIHAQKESTGNPYIFCTTNFC